MAILIALSIVIGMFIIITLIFDNTKTLIKGVTSSLGLSLITTSVIHLLPFISDKFFFIIAFPWAAGFSGGETEAYIVLVAQFIFVAFFLFAIIYPFKNHSS